MTRARHVPAHPARVVRHVPYAGDRMDGMEDMRQRVGRLESEMSDLSAKVGGAIHDIASMRASQDSIGSKIDALISTVTEMRARMHEPVNILDVTGKVLGIVFKGFGIFSGIVAAIFFLIQVYPSTKDGARVASTAAPAYVTIDGKRYPVSH